MNLSLFAQQNQFNNNPGGGGPDSALIAGIIIFYVVILAVALAVAIMFFLTLSRCLRECAPRNRTMEPGQVWLNLIPCFSLIWFFITVNRVAESLDNEFHDRRLRGDGDFGKSVGTVYAVCNVLSLVPYVNMISGIVGLVCFILYWVKIAGYSRQLREGGGDDDSDDRPSRRRYDDEDDDDRPRRRRDDDDDDR